MTAEQLALRCARSGADVVAEGLRATVAERSTAASLVVVHDEEAQDLFTAERFYVPDDGHDVRRIPTSIPSLAAYERRSGRNTH